MERITFLKKLFRWENKHKGPNMSTINTVFNTTNTKIFLSCVNDQGQTISFKTIQSTSCNSVSSTSFILKEVYYFQLYVLIHWAIWSLNKNPGLYSWKCMHWEFYEMHYFSTQSQFLLTQTFIRIIFPSCGCPFP